MSAEALILELGLLAGKTLRVEWPRGPGADADWRLAGELDWDEVDALRVVSAALPDRRGLAVAAVRPAGAAGHGEEEVAAVLVSRDAAEQVSEALLSVEHGADGLPRRVGIELYPGADALPLRVAADVTEARRDEEGQLARVRADLEVRLEGKRSTGRYEVLRPAAAPGPAW